LLPCMGMTAMETLDFDGLWDLIESKFTRHLHKRHTTAINRICEKRLHGIFIDELQEFTKLLNVCKEHIEHDRLQFLPCILNLLSVSLQPFVTTKSFEKIEHFDTICNYFKTVSALLSLKYTYLSITICRGLQNYIVDVLDYKVINECGIIEELTDSLRSWCYGARFKLEKFMHPQPQNEYVINVELSLQLISAIKTLSYSEDCVLSLVQKSNILELKILYDSDMDHLFLTHSIESLWNMIQILPLQSTQSHLELDYFNMFTSLLSKYLARIQSHHKVSDKHLVNSVLAILLLLAKHEHFHKLFEQSHIAHTLLSYTQHILTNQHLQTPPDFQMLCLILNIVHEIGCSFRILSLLIEHQFVVYIATQLFQRTADSASSPSSWTPTQELKIRVCAIHIFQTLIQSVPKYFFQARIPNLLVRFLVSYQHSISHRHSINKQIDTVSQSVLRFLATCLRTILPPNTGKNAKYQLSLSDDAIKQCVHGILNEDGLCELLLQIVNHVSFAQSTRIDAVLIISYLAQLDVEQNPFRQQHAQSITECVCTLLGTLPSLPIYTQFQHSLLHCLRTLTNRNPTNQAVLLQQEGIITLLIELMQKSGASIMESVINLLLQLLASESQTTVKRQIVSSYNHNRFQCVLFGIWQKCEENMQDVMTVRVMTGIHCLYKACSLGANASNTDIDAVEKHTVLKILNHCKLMEGKAWMQLQQDVQREAIELTESDSVTLAAKIKNFQNLQSQLALSQSSLQAIKEKKAEHNLHDLMQKLNLFQSQKKKNGGKLSMKQFNKQYLLASTIKLNKDQKDEMVANSLQLNETMNKVLGHDV